MHVLAGDKIRETSMASPGACFDDGNKFAKWIMWAAVMRLILAEWLFGTPKNSNHRELLDFTNTHWQTRMDAGMKTDLRRLISEFANGREGSSCLSFVSGRTIYRSLMRPLPYLANRREEQKRLRAHHCPETREEVFQKRPARSCRRLAWYMRSQC